MTKSVIESHDEILIDIAESLERIDIVMTHTPNGKDGMSYEQVWNYLRVRRLLAKARTIIEDADNIAQGLWSD